MTEINTNLPTNPIRRGRDARPQETNARANSIQGLASGLNTKQTIDTIIRVEQRRLRPVEARKTETQVELDAFTLVKDSLDILQENSRVLAERDIWEGKIVESSDESIVTALATAGAKPGKHTLVVDRLALNHQIASQGFENPEVAVGTGNFKISVGEETSFSVVIDQSNNTLNGLKTAINNASTDVSATIIKTGRKENPYQLVLTSQKTGSQGRIELEVGLTGGEAPSFTNSVDDPSDWKGVGPEAEERVVITGAGASTTIVRVVGDNTAEDDHTFTFTAIQTGQVGGENALQMRWLDETGRSGTLELDSFNYAPGEPIEFADGLSLILSQGEIIVGDTFSVQTRAEKSSLFWWIPPDERAAAFAQPTAWTRQATFGAPIIEGPFTGDEEQQFTLTVVGGGQIGSSSDLAIRWEVEDGQNGILRVGRGYQPGTKLALADGITMSLQPGVLAEGSFSTFTAIPSDTSAKWWLDEEERIIPSEIADVTAFEELAREDEEPEDIFAAGVEFPEELGPRKTAVDKEVTGTFEGDEAKVYTFTASQSGSVGTTKGMIINWVDDKGNSGSVDVGETYQTGTALPFDSGLSIAFGPGRIFGEDSFTVRTRTSTIQPAQDASIRFGATELGGGLEITNSTNELEGVIEGVKLNLVSVSEKPVTITISGDTEKAVESILGFANQFNQIVLLMNELTKFDEENNEAGVLLGDRDLTVIRDELSRLLMDPVAGLPKTLNMLFPLGLQLNREGILVINEETLRNKIADDFAGVADIFRNKGESDNAGISFLNMTDDTLESPDGLDVNIESTATQATYLTQALLEPITLDRTNNKFVITVDGTQSGEIEIPVGSFTLAEFAREVQNGIINDETVGGRRVRVVEENGALRITTGRYGSRGGIAFAGPAGGQVPPPGLLGGNTEPGQDVTGAINGEEAEGTGRLLKGSDDSETVAGLRLMITLGDNLLLPGAPEGKIKITKGVGSRLAVHLKNLLDPNSGNMQRITNSLRSQIQNIDDQLLRMNERIESKRTRLQARFARLEGQMSQLKSQQAFLGGQLANLPGGGSSGLPGL